MTSSIWVGILIPFLGTTLGAGCVFFLRKEIKSIVQKSLLGFASGVMVAASVWSLLIPALDMAEKTMGKKALIPASIGFLLGIGFLLLLDQLIPHLHLGDEKPEGLPKKLKKTTMLVLAVTLHNIPEGIAVSVPIYQATGSHKKAFWYSLLSGMAEPVGALIGFLFLLPFWTPTIHALLLAFVSGIMVFISFDELLPGAEKYGHHHYGIGGVITGMAVMAASLLFFI